MLMDSPQTQVPAPKQNKFPGVLIALLILVIVILFSAGTYVLGLKRVTVSPIARLVIPTPTSMPTPTPVMYAAPTIEVSSPEASLTKYTDKDIPFTIMYPKNWTLKKTYGKGIEKLAPTDVVTGIEVGNGGSTFVINLINPKSATSIVSWWKTGSHTAMDATQPNFSFRGLDAIKVSSTPGGNPPARVQDETYFLYKGYVYFLSMQYNPYAIDTDLVNIYNSILLAQ